MKRNACLAVLLTVSLTAGCVERRFVINSDPPGALVYHNGIYLGPTPVDGYIVYYGKQQFRLIKEGYQTLDIVQTYQPPWYELPGVDFFSENVWPFKVRDVRRFDFTMQPMQTVRPDDVRQQAEQLRARGQTIGLPLAPRPIAAPPSAPPPAPPSPQGPPPQGGILSGPIPAPSPSGAAPPVRVPGVLNGP
jgi:PEGA domain